mgnify:FL=1
MSYYDDDRWEMDHRLADMSYERENDDFIGTLIVWGFGICALVAGGAWVLHTIDAHLHWHAYDTVVGWLKSTGLM